MGHNVKIRGVEREFDPQRYAHLVIALAKELASREPAAAAPKRRQRKAQAQGDDG